MTQYLIGAIVLTMHKGVYSVHLVACLTKVDVCSAAQFTPPVQAQTPVPPLRPAMLSSAPTPVPASTPLPHLGGPLTPFPAPAEPRSDDEVAEQWSRGMAMLHDEMLAQVVTIVT